jgi:hypothetical protein
MTIIHDTQASIDFLRKWEAEGPWVLVAIVPDGRVSARCFYPTDATALAAWIEEKQGRENIYFHVNRVSHPVNKKAEKGDIALVRYFHVDIDPAPGKDFDAERSKALAQLQSFNPAPTVIIDSGGGYQGFWKLLEGLPVNGQEAAAAEAEAYNIHLESVFSADHCHNVDRIMRLPGTVNVPNKKKLAKGRQARLATLVEFNSYTYPVALFTSAPRVQGGSGGEGTHARNRVKISGNLARFNSVDELPSAVSDRTKMLIVQGTDPEEPGKYPSRSEVLFRVTCDLVRAGCDDNTIAMVLLDPDFGISSSVLEKSRPEAYAAKQIAKAKDEAIAPELRELNEKYAVIGTDGGGRCRIISEQYDHMLKRSKLIRQSFEDFQNWYRNRELVVNIVNGKPITAKLGKWWIEHPMRRQYQAVQFVPGQELDGQYYNLWKGFAVDSKPGRKHENFLEHVRKNLCESDEDLYKYVLGWMARAIQMPDRPGEVAIVLRGKRGTGKSFFAKVLGSLFGQHFLSISDPKHLVGSFNAHLRDCVMLFADEAFYAGDKKHESILKTLITEETLSIEAKGVDVENSSNYIHLLMASNDDWVVPAGYDERRYLVLDVGDAVKQDHGYFARLRAELDEGGLSHLLHFLLTYDITEYNVRKVPETRGLTDQKQMSRKPEESWWFNKLQDGRVLDQKHWEEDISKDDLYDDYVEEMENMGIHRRHSREALGRFLTKVCSPPGAATYEEKWPKVFQKEVTYSVRGKFGEEVSAKGRKRFNKFPSLKQCRAVFDKDFGGPYEWHSEEPMQPSLTRQPF